MHRIHITLSLLITETIVFFHTVYYNGPEAFFICKGIECRAGVTNLSEPESYFMGTESYEGHPVLYTLLK